MSNGSNSRRSRRLALISAAALAIVVAALVAVAPAVVAGTGRANQAGLSFGTRPSPAANSGSVSKALFGKFRGRKVFIYTLTNGAGMKVRIMTYGATVQSIDVPGSNGDVENVALGFRRLADYVANTRAHTGETYFGATIGRYANRIAKGRFTLDGKTYHLPQNNGTNTLHGGPHGFDEKIWHAKATHGPDGPGVTMRYTSPDGQEGFPGTLAVRVSFTLTDANGLWIRYRATTDKPTVVNLTNHTYFNLAGEGSGDVYHQVLQLDADSYTPVNANLIPTGEIAPVAGTPLDFTHPTPIGKRIRDGFRQLVLAHGYDHNFVINRPQSATALLPAAVAEDPKSGRELRVWTTEPGIQFYSGNFLDGSLVGTSGKTYRQGDGFTLETQHYPNSPNEPDFPSTVLRPGETFNSTTVYDFSTAGSMK
jgi:aldose 1-epimerase